MSWSRSGPSPGHTMPNQVCCVIQEPRTVIGGTVAGPKTVQCTKREGIYIYNNWLN